MSRGKILVVDDSEIALEVAEMALAEAGYDVATVASAFKLTPAIREHRPDVILLDVRMPALSGEKAAQILKQYNFSRHIPILLYSSLEADELERLVGVTGASGFIRKDGFGEGLAKAVEPWVARVKLGIEA